MKSIILLPLFILAACNYSINTTSKDPFIVKLDVSTNFVEGKTGWVTASGAPARFTINKNNLTSGHASRYECRAGLKNLINTIAFSDCSSGTFLPTPTVGGDQFFSNKNGTYTFEIRAIDLKNTQVATHSQNFYIHDSLDSVPTCNTQAFSDEQYYATASQYLSMTSHFGDATVLKAPFYKIEFGRPVIIFNPWQKTENLRSLPTLRKSVRLNSDKTLLLVRRTHPKWISGEYHDYSHGGTTSNDPSFVSIHPTNSFANYQKSDTACSIAVDTRNIARERYYPSIIYDGNGDPDQSKFNLHREVSAGNGVISHSDEANVSFGTYYFITTINQLLPPVRPLVLNYPVPLGYSRKILEDYTNGVRTIRPLLYGFNANCDVLVANAQGKGLCFHSQTLQEPIQLKTVTVNFPRFDVESSTASLSKYKVLKNAHWQEMVDNLSSSQLEDSYRDKLFLNP